MEDKNEGSEVERPELNVEQEIYNFFAHQFTGKPEDWLTSQKALLREIIKAVESIAELKILEGQLAEVKIIAGRFSYDKKATELFEALIELRGSQIDRTKASIFKYFKIEEVKFLKFE